MESTYKCYLYHIVREKDMFDLTKGYIGVSLYPKKRWDTHKNRSQNPHLRNAFQKYTDIIQYILLCGEEDYCYLLEEELRPEKNIGWNIAVGGSKPPSPKGTKFCISQLPADKRRKDYIVSEETKEKLRAHQILHKEHFSAIKKGSKNPMFSKYGELNPNFNGYYITPDGIFTSQPQVGGYYGINRNTVSSRFIGNNEIVIKKSRWHPRDYWGKTWKELGWIFEGGVMDINIIKDKYGWGTPRLYGFASKDDLHSLIESLPNWEEGVVLYNLEGEPKYKWKASTYLKLHRIRGESIPTPKRIMDLVFTKETDEYLTYFKEDTYLFTPYINAFSELYTEYCEVEGEHRHIEDQKEYALAVKDYPFKGLLFQKRKNSKLKFREMFNRLPNKAKYRMMESYIK